MTHYSRHQLLLILLLVAAAGAGLAIDHWRRARPDVVERLERLDRVEPATAPAPAPREARRMTREPRDSEHTTRERGVRGMHERATGGTPTRERSARGEPAHERGAAPASDAPLDVNEASAPELARLPGIGTTLAARIVQARPFAALDELARVRGLRPVTLARVRPLLTTLPLP
ncbi:MAG TPA: helix-hairpin-helix domain-containing protein [Methylomirabilota bacterium]|jgi:competence protein ComEA